MIHPLIHHADRTLKTRHVRDRIFREHCQAEALEQLGNSMVDLGIEVIRPARQHDAMRARVLHPFERLFALVADILLEGHIFSPSSFDRRFDVLLARQLALYILHELRMLLDQLHVETLLQMVFLVIRNERVQELNIRFVELVDIQAQGLGIAHDDRAVEMIACTFVFLTLPFRTGHPDKIDILIEQVHHMTMRELRRIAHALGRHGLDARFVGLLRRSVRNLNAEPKLIEEREPERIVFIHVERTRYAHRATRCRFGGKRFVVIEETCGLVLEEVRHLGLDSLGARALLAAIARDEAAMAAGCFIDTEIIHREQACIRTGLATHGTMGRRKRFDLFERKHARLRHFRTHIRRQRLIVERLFDLRIAIARQ